MKAEIKDIYSIDLKGLPLQVFKPIEADNFGIRLRMVIGPKGDKGEESFDMFLCTPKWLLENHNKAEILFGRHLLIAFEYDLNRIMDKLHKYVESITGSNWDEIGQKLARIGYWEFEDYN